MPAGADCCAGPRVLPGPGPLAAAAARRSRPVHLRGADESDESRHAVSAGLPASRALRVTCHSCCSLLAAALRCVKWINCSRQVSPGMALLQSLRQNEAPPTDALAAVQPPPATVTPGSSANHNEPPGGSSVAAGSSGAALLQQLQGLSVAQRPAPSAAEAAAAPSGEGSSTGSTSDVQVRHWSD